MDLSTQIRSQCIREIERLKRIVAVIDSDAAPVTIETKSRRTKPAQGSRLKEAVEWLRDYMASGREYPAKKLLSAALKAGICRTTLKNAGKQLGLRTRKGRSVDAGWIWQTK